LRGRPAPIGLQPVSTERQLGARGRRDAARRREQAALERAARSEAGADLGAARTQRAIADMHARAPATGSSGPWAATGSS